VEGADRTYVLYVPASYDGTRPVPVVLNFHGFGSNAEQQIAYGDFRPLADREGFLVVAPDGQGTPRHFNLLGALPGEQDDVTFTRALIDHLEAAFCVDSRRVYATGMSNGGALTSVLACRASDRLAAFGSVAAVIFLGGCGRPAPIAAFAGTSDPVVPYEGGTIKCCGGSSYPPTEETMAKWASHDGCDNAPADSRLSAMVRLRQFEGCQAGAEVRLYTIEGGGHTWPGTRVEVPLLGTTTKEIDASEVLWTFFAAHPLPG
jgi:polyhydroxybutyrate depolymerase